MSLSLQLSAVIVGSGSLGGVGSGLLKLRAFATASQALTWFSLNIWEYKFKVVNVLKGHTFFSSIKPRNHAVSLFLVISSLALFGSGLSSNL